MDCCLPDSAADVFWMYVRASYPTADPACSNGVADFT